MPRVRIRSVKCFESSGVAPTRIKTKFAWLGQKGIPAVCSPVGANRDIIHDEVDGFLPRGRDDWFQTIVRLAKDPFLRETIGHAGRRRVEQAFSLAFHGPGLVQAIEQAQRALRKSA